MARGAFPAKVLVGADPAFSRGGNGSVSVGRSPAGLTDLHRGTPSLCKFPQLARLAGRWDFFFFFLSPFSLPYHVFELLSYRRH